MYNALKYEIDAVNRDKATLWTHGSRFTGSRVDSLDKDSGSEYL